MIPDEILVRRGQQRGEALEEGKRLGERGRKDDMPRWLRRTNGSLIRLRQPLYIANKVHPKGSYLTNVMVGVSTTLPNDPVLAKLISERAKAAGLKRPRGVH